MAPDAVLAGTPDPIDVAVPVEGVAESASGGKAQPAAVGPAGAGSPNGGFLAAVSGPEVRPQPPRSTDPVIGRTLGDFEVELLIGRGGMGSVYRAEQRKLGRKVALKVLSAEWASSAEFRARFLSESRTAASLDHPNILPVYDAGEDGDLLYIAMRLVEGTQTDLQALLEREGALRPERALAIVTQVASALDAAHAAGLVHRDVKPGNVLLAGDHVYLTDFGIAKQSSGRRELTRTGAFVGTLDYASPEQIRNDAVDGSTDIYSLGALLFHCLSGGVPFDRPSDYGVMKAHLEEPPPALSAMRPDLPPTLDAIFATAMAKEKDERYRSGRHLMDAARAALAGEAVPAPVSIVRPTVVAAPPPIAPTRVGTAPQAIEVARRHRSAWLLPAALGVAVAGTFAYMIFRPATADPVEVTLSAEVPTGSSVTARLTDPKTGSQRGEITFTNVSTPGQVTMTLSKKEPTAPLPAGYVLVESYDVTTTAAFSGSAVACFIDDKVTDRSHLYHFSADQWTDRTMKASPPRICGTFPSFSPVVIADESLPKATPAPTATGGPTPTPTLTGSVTPTPTPSASTVVAPTPPQAPVVRGLGCTVSGQATRSVACSPQVSGALAGATYSWSASGGSPVAGSSSTFSTSFDPSRPGTFRITLIVCNGPSCAPGEQTISVDPNAPTINSVGCASSVQVGQTVSCSPSVSGALSGMTYTWSASGGSPSTGSGSSFSTSFAQAGTFTISLQACNRSACDNKPQSVTVAYPAPVINYVGCPNSAQVGQTVSCSPSVSGTTSITTYQWSASGGSPSTGSGSSFSTSFAQAGTFTISLQACNGSACDNRPQSVAVAYPAPMVNFVGCTSSVQVGQTLSCSPSVTGTTSITTYQWSASGGSPSTGSGSSFSTSFAQAGTFTISLQACNGSACDNKPQSVSVAYPAPVINYVGCPNSTQVNETITCFPSVSGTTSSTTYACGGGAALNCGGSQFLARFSSPGSFIVTLQACNGNACANGQQSVSVTLPPTPAPTLPPTTVPTVAPQPTPFGSSSFAVPVSTGADAPVTINAGDRITISATGTVLFNGGNPDAQSPNGDATCRGISSSERQQFTLPSAPCFGMIGRIGSGPWEFIGSSRQWTAATSGTLRLTMNDNFYPDNVGSWQVTISVAR